MSTFHEGERAVQEHAGVADAAARLSGMLAPARLGEGFGHVLAAQTFAALTARDGAGRLWISPLTGPPGFLQGAAATLTIAGAPPATDPLHGLPAHQPVGLVAVDFARRRRVRVNGTLTRVDAAGLVVEVEQAYGNCPQYIGRRRLDPDTAGPGTAGAVRRSDTLTGEGRALIASADTFFLGTVHPSRGADASHRGGAPGFVRTVDGRLWWPDYPGNNMFNSLGNLAVEPSVALLFPDFDGGRSLHVSGTAEIEWTAPDAAGDDGRTGRRVWVTPQRVTLAADLPLHASLSLPAADTFALGGA